MTRWPPNYHTADGEPSRAAAREAETWRETHAERVLAALRDSPEPLTAAEVGRLTRLGDVETRRRLYDLSRADPPLVRRMGQRPCRVTARKLTTWAPIPKQEPARQERLL